MILKNIFYRIVLKLETKNLPLRGYARPTQYAVGFAMPATFSYNSQTHLVIWGM